MTAREYVQRAIERRQGGEGIVAALGVSVTDAKNDPWWLAVRSFVMHLPDADGPMRFSDFTDAQVDAALASALEDVS